MNKYIKSIYVTYIYIYILKLTNKDYCITQGALLNTIMAYRGKKSEKKWIYVCVCI